MKRCTFWIVALFLLSAPSFALAQATVYWDRNGTDPGGLNGVTFGDGTWSTTDANWNASSDGTGALSGWVAGNHAVFSAGSDVQGDPIVDAQVSIIDAGTTPANTMAVASMLVEEGHVYLQAGTVDAGANDITVNSGAMLSVNSTSRLNTGAGRVVLNGGTLMERNSGNAGTFIGSSAGLKGIHVNGTGTIGYADGNATPDNQVSIFFGVITGEGGTTTNGGAGTLIKTGPDQFGLGVSNQGGVHSHTLMTFAKLVVEEGAYRLRTTTFDGTAKETGFGAVPLAVLPDAITLNGGGIGTSGSVTLHANRGITIGAEGGYLDHGATAGISIPGPLTGSSTLTVGSPTSTSTSNPQFELTNTGNASTFTGNLHVLRSTLSVPDAAALGAVPGAPVADSITLGGTAVATTGPATLRFSASTTLAANRGITLAGTVDGRINIPSGGNTLTYDGAISGPGKLIKMGDGTLTSSGTHSHGGGTDIFGRFNVNGGLSGSGAVTVKTASTLGTNGTLAGTGTVAGLVTVESGGHIAPGASIGTLNATGGVTLSAGSILDFELGAPGTSDLLNLGSGALTVNGVGTVNLINAGGMAAGTYSLIDYGTIGGAELAAFLGQTPTGPAGFTYSLVDTGSLINLNVAALATNDADFNQDGTIDAADYPVWRKFNPLASGATQGTGDADGNGTNDNADYTKWVTTYGQASPGAGGGGSGAVPEPTGIVMLVLGLAVAASRRSR